MVQIIKALPIIAAFIGAANAHAHVWGIAVNGVAGGTGANGDARSEFIRSPPNNNPVKDPSSDDIICNVNGFTEAPKWLSAKAGDKLDVTWYHDNYNDDIIAASHVGPITVYIAPAESNGKGKVWSKIYEDGYSNGKWAVDKLIANKGIHSLTLPAGLAKGKYLMRTEIIAHHESETDYAVNSARGAQYYPSCAQLEITSGGSAVPSGYGFKTSDGGYTTTDPGIMFNIYSSFTSYPIPGPAVWDAASSGTTPEVTTAAPVVTPTTTSAPVVVAPTTTAVAVPTTISVPVVVPTTTSAPVVEPTRVPTSSIKSPTFTTSTAITKPTTAAPVVTQTPTNPTAPKDRNSCFNDVNKCYSAAQPKNGLGTPEAAQAFAAAWSACQAQWKVCETL